MTDKGRKFEVVNRDGEVFEGTTMAEARAKMIAAARDEMARRHAANPDAVPQFNLRMARLAAARKREQQRFDHLVMGKPRPVERVTEGRKSGRRRPKTVERPVRLEPGIEEAVQLREAWDHKVYGTPETHERASRTHSGALAQLNRNGTITNDQLEWAAQIANVYRSLEADVAVKVASLEARVDQSRRSGDAAESVYRVRMHLAYGYWRDLIPVPKQLVLDMIVDDAIGYTIAARIYRVHNRRAKRLLLEALDRWPRCVAHAFSMVDHATADAMNHGRTVDPVWLDGPSKAYWGQVDPTAPPTTGQPAIIGIDLASRPELSGPVQTLDPAFLDERGLLREWSEIAEIIRARLVE
ncbi:MAG: hypothetical protein AB7E55_22740 [Pigmentiphaga sp.]